MLVAHYSLTPTHVRVVALQPYHNGTVQDRLGCDWRPREERVIPLSAWAYIKRDIGDADAYFRVTERLTLVDDGNDS